MDNFFNSHYGVRFFFKVAAYITVEIMWLNDGHWPESFSEWRRVAEAIEYELLIIRDAPEIQSCCLFDENVILIQPSSCPLAFHKAMAHEVTHAMLDRGQPDGELLDWPCDPDDCHLVARMVESFIDSEQVTRLVGYSVPGELERTDFIR